MVNKKVTPAMFERWKQEIRSRIYQERKTNIIEDIARHEGLSHSCVYYWTMPQHYREKRKQYTRAYQQEHLEECMEKSRKYGAQHRQKHAEQQRIRYADPEIRAHNCAQTRLRWKVRNHIDQFLPEIVSEGDEPITTKEMANTLQNITKGITVLPFTLEKSIEHYLAHNPSPMIKEVSPNKYIRI